MATFESFRKLTSQDLQDYAKAHAKASNNSKTQTHEYLLEDDTWGSRENFDLESFRRHHGYYNDEAYRLEHEMSNSKDSDCFDDCPKDCTCSDCQVIHRTVEWISKAQKKKADLSYTSHATLVVPRTLKGDSLARHFGYDYTYYQAVCSCGWSGDYRVSKLTAQEDKCPNR